MNGKNEPESPQARSFDDVLIAAEADAAQTLAAASGLASLARRLKKAAVDGNLGVLHKLGGELDDHRTQVRATTHDLGISLNSVRLWPASGINEAVSFKERYSSELRAVAAASGINIEERDGHMASFPSVVSVSDERSVAIDRKKLPGIRPSRVVDKLQENRRKIDRYSPAQFLEALHNVYAHLAKNEMSKSLQTGEGPVVPLIAVYKILTVRPGSTRDYTKVDFARDLFGLEYKGLNRTKKGAEVALTGSSGTRQSGTFSFVGPDGQVGTWSGVRFRMSD